MTVEIYRITDAFPSKEKYGLVSQVDRAAVSIPSNIAEGCSRSEKEIETQLVISKKNWIAFKREIY